MLPPHPLGVAPRVESALCAVAKSFAKMNINKFSPMPESVRWAKTTKTNYVSNYRLLDRLCSLFKRQNRWKRAQLRGK